MAVLYCHMAQTRAFHVRNCITSTVLARTEGAGCCEHSENDSSAAQVASALSGLCFSSALRDGHQLCQ